MAKPPTTPAISQALATQMENDMAALLLVRRATQFENSALVAADRGNTGAATSKLTRARALRAVARRLVLTDRPASLGVPPWA